MSNFYGDQYQDAYVDVPSSKIHQGDLSGDVQVMVAEFTPAAELTTADTLYLGKLPAGARVLNCKLRFPASGATGIVDIGYQANGVDAADLDGFVVGADPGAAAVLADGLGAGIGKRLGAESIVVMTPSENTAAATGKLIQVIIQYSVY